MSSLVHPGRTVTARAEGGGSAEIVRRPRPSGPATVVAPRGRTVGEVMTRSPLTVHRSASLWTAWDRMRGARHRHVVVVDDHRRPLGVLDERAVALEWPSGPLAAHRLPVTTLLRDLARPRVSGTDDLASVARIMLGAGADAVPVVDGEGRLTGLITLWHYAGLAAGADVPEEGLARALP